MLPTKFQFIWLRGFRRLKCEKLTDDKWWQKLTLPLARWAKKKIKQNYTIDKSLVCLQSEGRTSWLDVCFIFFLAHLAKGNVSFCHHLSSVNFSHFNLHKLCATFSANVNINYRLPIKAHYRICTLRHIRIKINHGSQICICYLDVVTILTFI
jgi:hypothetical protein